jgi:hypothetical protein
VEDMFTMEDIDLHDASAVLAAFADLTIQPAPESDALAHPTDYFIVGA